MAGGWRKFPKTKILEAIKNSGGNKMLISRRVGCNRDTLNQYLAAYPELQKAYDDEIEELGDVVEAKTVQGIQEGNIALAIFYAKTKLKNRGYVERQEVERTQPVVIHIDGDDAKL